MSAVPPSFRGLGRVGLAGGGAARSGRRTARPHARPAAPPIHHEDSQNEAAMTSEIWEPISVRAADRHHVGPPPDGFSLEGGAPWGQAFRELPPPEILALLGTETGPDWIPSRRRGSPQEPERPAWESDRLTHGQASIVRWFYAGLSGGSLRAFGCRAGSSVIEWIPRQDWMRLGGIDHGEAWRHMFKGLSAFRLEEGGQAWSEVRVTFCDQIDTDLIPAERRGVSGANEIPPRYAYRRKWSDEAKPASRSLDPSAGHGTTPTNSTLNSEPAIISRPKKKRNTREIDDEILLNRMAEIISSTGINPWPAALSAVKESGIPSHGQDSARTRLVRKHKKRLEDRAQSTADDQLSSSNVSQNHKTTSGPGE